ncbi:hypothetical protein VTO73DRAFT_7942 [Trametes versicolor]
MDPFDSSLRLCSSLDVQTSNSFLERPQVLLLFKNGGVGRSPQPSRRSYARLSCGALAYCGCALADTRRARQFAHAAAGREIKSTVTTHLASDALNSDLIGPKRRGLSHIYVDLTIQGLKRFSISCRAQNTYCQGYHGTEQRAECSPFGDCMTSRESEGEEQKVHPLATVSVRDCAPVLGMAATMYRGW